MKNNNHFNRFNLLVWLTIFIVTILIWFVVLEINYNKPFDLESDQGIVTLLFITSIVLML